MEITDRENEENHTNVKQCHKLAYACLKKNSFNIKSISPSNPKALL